MNLFNYFKLILLAALFVWTTNDAFAQCGAAAITSSIPNQIFVCNPNGPFNGTINFTGMPAGTLITLEFSDVPGLSFVGDNGSINATLVDDSDPTNVVYSVNVINAVINFQAEVGCAALALNNQSLTFDVVLDCGTTFQTNTFGVRSPVLNIVSQVNNPEPIPTGGTFTRTTTVCNSGQGNLDNFVYTSSSDPGLTPTSVTVNGTAVTNNGNPANNEVSVDVTSALLPGGELAFNGCVDIVETFDVLGCGILNTSSSVSWGCFGEVCETSTTAKTIQVTNVEPDFELGLTIDYADCPADGFTKNFTVTNTSTSPGFDVCFELLTFQDAIDLSTLAFTVGGNPITSVMTPNPLPNPIDPDNVSQEFYVESAEPFAIGCTTGAADPVRFTTVCFSVVNGGEVIEGSFTQYACDCDYYACNSEYKNQQIDVQNLSWTNVCSSEFTKPGRIRQNETSGIVDTGVPSTTNNGDQTYDYCYPIQRWITNFSDPDKCSDCAFEFQYTVQPGLDIASSFPNPYLFTDLNGNQWPGTVSVSTDGAGNDVVSILFDNDNHPASFDGTGADICITVEEDCSELADPGCGSLEVVVSESIFFYQNQTSCPDCIASVECPDSKSVVFSSCAPGTCICDLNFTLEADRSTLGCAADGCTTDDFDTKKVLVGDLVNVTSNITIDGASTYDQLFVNLDVVGAMIDITGVQGTGDITVMVNGGAACTIPTPTDLSLPIDLSSCTGTLATGDEVDVQFEIQVIKDINNQVSPFQLTAGLSLLEVGTGTDQAVECPDPVIDFILHGSTEYNGTWVSNNPDIIGCGSTILNSTWRHEVGATFNTDYFPCEIRTVHYPQTATVTVPAGYILEVARIDMLVDDPNSSAPVRVRHDMPVNIVGPTTYQVSFDTVFVNDPLVGGINDCALDEGYRLEIRYEYSATCNTPEGSAIVELTDLNFGYLDVLESSNYDPESFLTVATPPVFPIQEEITYTPIDVSLQSQVGIPYNFPDAPQNPDGTFPFNWELTLANLTGLASAENVYVFFDSLPTGVTIGSLEAGGCGGTEITPDTDIYNFGDLIPNGLEDVCINGTYTGCQAGFDTIRVGYGFICEREATSVSDLMDNLMCDVEYIDLIFERPTYDIQISDQTVIPAGGLTLCETLDIVTRISNGGTGNLFNTPLEFFVPTGVTYVPGSASICYNADNANGLEIPAEDFAIADPTNNGNIYTFADLGSPSGAFAGFADGFPGANAENLPGNLNEMFLKFQVETDCDIISGEQLDFNITADNRCGELADGDFSPGVSLDVAGVVQPNAFSLNVTDAMLDPCTPNTTQMIMITTTAQNDDATGGAGDELDFVQVCLEAGLDFVSVAGTVQGDGSVCAVIPVPDDVANPSLNVEIEVTDPTLEASDGPLDIDVTALADQSVFCNVAGTNCEIKIPSEEEASVVNLMPSGCNCTLTLGAAVLTCVTSTDGVDEYTVSIPFDNGAAGAPGAGGYTIVSTGTIGGDNPMTMATGTITLTYTEGTDYSYQITGTLGNANESCDLSITGTSIACEACAADNGTLMFMNN